MARGDPFIPASVNPGGGTIVVPGSGRSGPQIPYGIGGLLAQRGGYGAIGSQMDELFRRRRLLGERGQPNPTRRYGDTPEGQGQPYTPPTQQRPPALPPPGGVYDAPESDPYWDEYRKFGQEGMFRRDVPSWGITQTEGYGNYPSINRFREILTAQQRLGGAPLFRRSRSSGQGAQIEEYPDMLRKLLRERGGY